MRVLACGGRDFFGRNLVYAVLDPMVIDVLIEGEAPGADTLAREWATEQGIPVERYPADWNRHGKAAGPIRNRRMLVEGKPDLVVAFPGGRGTANMISQAEAAGVKVLKVTP